MKLDSFVKCTLKKKIVLLTCYDGGRACVQQELGAYASTCA